MSLSRPWDAFDAYLFDIDGTLLHSRDAVHYFAFCEALSAVAGRPLNLDGVLTHGNVDAGILREAWMLAGVDERTWRPRLAEARAQMCRFVETNKADMRVTVLPGVVPVLQHLKRRGALLGTGTGNFAGIGRIKLEAAGLERYFDFEGFSDGCEYRAAVIARAAATARAMRGADAALVVLGDTPYDVIAAHENGLECIAIASGTYSREKLAESSPELLVGSLKVF